MFSPFFWWSIQWGIPLLPWSLKGVQPNRYWRFSSESFYCVDFHACDQQIGSAILTQLEVSEITVRLTTGLILLLWLYGCCLPLQETIRQRVKPEWKIFHCSSGYSFDCISCSSCDHHALFSYLRRLLMPRFIYPGCVVCFFSYFVSHRSIVRFLGQNGLLALERLLALILVMLAIQQMLMGIELFQTTYLK